MEWETDNELVAEVSQDGIVRGINAGTANITARTSNGIEAVCSITVKVPAKKLKLDMSKLTLKKGRKKKVRVVMTLWILRMRLCGQAVILRLSG